MERALAVVLVVAVGTSCMTAHLRARRSRMLLGHASLAGPHTPADVADAGPIKSG